MNSVFKNIIALVISILCIFIFIGLKNTLIFCGIIMLILISICLLFKDKIKHYQKNKEARIFIKNIYILYRKENDFLEETFQILPKKIIKLIYEKNDISQKLDFLKQYYHYQPLDIMCSLLLKNCKDDTGYYYKLIYYYSEIYYDSKYIEGFISFIKKTAFILIKTIVCIELIILIFPSIFSRIDIKKMNMLFLFTLLSGLVLITIKMIKEHYSHQYFYYRMFSEFCARIHEGTPYKALELSIKNNLKYDKNYSLVLNAYQNKNIKLFYEFYQSHKFEYSMETMDVLYKISLNNNLKSEGKIYIEMILNKLHNSSVSLNAYLDMFDTFTCLIMSIFILLIYYLNIMG